MMSRRLYPALLLAALPLLAACETLDGLVSWSAPKAQIQGERVAIMTPEQELKADAALTAQVTVPAAVRNTEWTQPGGNAENNMPNLEGGNLRSAWSADAGKGSDRDSRLTAPPIIAGGMVYTLDAEASVFAFNADTGARQWEINLAPAGTDDPKRGFGGGLAYANGKLFAASGFGEVKALDPKTGAVTWTAKTKTPVRTAPVVSENRIYVITQENELVVLSTEDGRQLWSHNGIVESAAVLASSSVGVAGQSVIAPYTSGELFALRVENGVTSWTESLTRSGTVTALTDINDIAGRPLVDRDMVFAINHSGTFIGIDLRTGRRAWSRSVAGLQTPLASGDFVFVVTIDGKVLCVNRTDGRVKWISQLPAFGDEEDREDPIVWTGPLMLSGKLVLFSSLGSAISLNPATGERMGETELPGGTYVHPSVANGTVYLLTNDAKLVALR